MISNQVYKLYLRPVSGCINAGCAVAVAVLGCGLGLLTFVLLLANSKRMVWGMSGSKRTPCCKIYIGTYTHNSCG